MTKAESYKLIEQEFKAIFAGTSPPWEARASTLVALIKTYLPVVSWVGFYLQQVPDESLWVACYQGPIACTQIPKGRGVCGKAFAESRVLVVPNVHEFEDHIACDSRAQSEIVLPLFRNGRAIGVLDVDSHQLSAFDELDRDALSKLLKLLS